MRRFAFPVLLALITLAIYAQAAKFDYISFDDPSYVRDNANVLDGLSWNGLVWAFTTTSQANWHPLTWLSLQLDAEVSGVSPRGYHATNVVLHVINAILVYLLFAAMTRSAWQSALVAALFAVHPIHVESVAWIAERKDVLSTAFGLAACLAWVRERRGLAIAAYAASLLAKPMLVSLPVLLLLIDFWPLRRTEPWRKLVLEKAPLAALAAASCVVTYVVQSGGGMTRTLTQYPVTMRAANAAVVVFKYLGNTIWPMRLALYYPYPYGGIPAWQVIAAVVALVLITAACVRLRTSAPQLLVGWSWYLITLLPVIGLVQVGSQAMADRYTYVPLIGPFAMLAFSLPQRVSRALAAAATVVILALSFVAFRQTGYWRDSLTVFSRSLAVTKDNAVAENGVATALFAKGQIAEAVAHCEAAVRIAPGMADPEANLVRGLLALGRVPEAAARTRDALRDRPNDSRTHVNAGLVARYEGRDADAESSFRQAVHLNPEDQEAHLNLGGVLNALGRRDEARAEFEEAVRLRPSDARARNALDRLLANQ